MKKRKNLCKLTAWTLILAMLLQSSAPGFGVSARAEETEEIATVGETDEAAALETTAKETEAQAADEDALAAEAEAAGEDALTAETEAQTADEDALTKETETETETEADGEDVLTAEAEAEAADQEADGEEAEEFYHYDGTEIDVNDEGFIAAEQLVELAPAQYTEAELFPGINPWSGVAYDPVCGGSVLNEEEQKLYDQLVQASIDVMCGRYNDKKGNIVSPLFQAKGLSLEGVKKVCNVFLDNNPIAFWSGGYNYGKTASGYAASFGVRGEYRNYATMIAKWNEMLPEIMCYLDGASVYSDDYSRAKYLYKELTTGKTYARDENGEPSEEPEAHNIEGILVDKSAVCEGFAKTYALLLNACGIPNYVASGWAKNGTGHAWNLVQIDGKAYLCDATWDADVSEDEWYWFMIGTAQDDGSHVSCKEDVKVPIPAKWDYENTVDECKIEEKNLVKTVSLGEPVKIELVNFKNTDNPRSIYYNGLRLPITQSAGKDWIEVYEGGNLEIRAVSNDKKHFTVTVNTSGVEAQYDMKVGADDVCSYGPVKVNQNVSLISVEEAVNKITSIWGVQKV